MREQALPGFRLNLFKSGMLRILALAKINCILANVTAAITVPLKSLDYLMAIALTCNHSAFGFWDGNTAGRGHRRFIVPCSACNNLRKCARRALR